MADYLSAISSITKLITVPIWTLIALAIASAAVLFMPSCGPINFDLIRKDWGGVLSIALVFFSVLSLVGQINNAFANLSRYRTARRERRSLRFVALPAQSWWHLGVQPDGTVTSQLQVHLVCTNLSAKTALLLNPRLRGHEILHADATSSVPASDSVTRIINLILIGAIGRRGKQVSRALILDDHMGERYVIVCKLRTADKPGPAMTFRHCLNWLKKNSFDCFLQKPKEVLEPKNPWTYEDGINYIADC